MMAPDLARRFTSTPMLFLLSLGQTRTVAEPAWWAPLQRFQTVLGSSALPVIGRSPVAQATCPEAPFPDASFEIIPDGGCHTASDGNPAGGQVTLAYRIVCNANGSTTVTYLSPASKDQPDACNEAEGVNVTIPAAYCFNFSLPFQGTRFSCGASGNATLYGWSAQLPTFNQSNDMVVTRDGARLVTQTVFPAKVAFPPTGKKKWATLFVQTPYDVDADFSAAIKTLPRMIGTCLATPDGPGASRHA